MTLVGLLALIVGASVTPVTSSGLIAGGLATIGGGIASNRADAAFWWSCQSLAKALRQQETAPMREVLRQALQLSYLQALKSVCSECKAELIGEFELKYRGQPAYSSYSSDIRKDVQWLGEKINQLDEKIRAIEKGDLAGVPDISLQALEKLTTQTNGLPQGAKKAAEESLIKSAIKVGDIALYTEKLNHPTTGLFERICGFFAQQLSQDAALQAFFETQLLVQINSGLSEQKITLQNVQQTLNNLAQLVPKQLNQALVKLESLQIGQEIADERTGSILGSIQEIKAMMKALIQRKDIALLPPNQPEGSQNGEGAVAIDSLSIRKVIEPNPFGPLGGRIDTPHQFFGRKPLLKKIFEILNGGMSIALIGDREIGKSSLLKAVHHQAKGALTIYREPIYLDLRHVENESDFYLALCGEIGIEECKGYRLTRALKSKRLLLLLDELEKMTWDGFSNHVRGQLRGLAEGREAPLRLVMAATQPLDRLFPIGTQHNMVSPLSGICLEETVGLWDDTTAQAFITDRLQRTSVQFTGIEIEDIIRQCQGQPKQVVGHCYQCYERYQGLEP